MYTTDYCEIQLLDHSISVATNKYNELEDPGYQIQSLCQIIRIIL